MNCIFDRDDECTGNCPNCTMYKHNECCKCGATGKLKLYEDGEYYCPDCLAEKLIGDSELVAPLAAFLDRNVESFAEYLAKVC